MKKERIKKFMKHFTDTDVSKILEHNFVCSNIFDWDLENWCKRKTVAEKNEEIVKKKGFIR